MKKTKGASPEYNDCTSTIIAIGNIIKNERLRQGMTQKILAQKCRISVTQLHRIEHGKGKPLLLVYLKMFPALGLDLSDSIRQLESKN